MISDYLVYHYQAEMQATIKLCLEFIQDVVSTFTLKIPICKKELTEEKYQSVPKKAG